MTIILSSSTAPHFKFLTPALNTFKERIQNLKIPNNIIYHTFLKVKYNYNIILFFFILKFYLNDSDNIFIYLVRNVMHILFLLHDIDKI